MAIVRECTGHTCHSQHHVLWYDNRLIKYLHSILKKGMFLKVRGGKFNHPVQGWGSACRFGARSEGSQRVRSINRIAPQGSHRYSRRGHDTIVLHHLDSHTAPELWVPMCNLFLALYALVPLFLCSSQQIRSPHSPPQTHTHTHTQTHTHTPPPPPNMAAAASNG